MIGLSVSTLTVKLTFVFLRGSISFWAENKIPEKPFSASKVNRSLLNSEDGEPEAYKRRSYQS